MNSYSTRSIGVYIIALRAKQLTNDGGIVLFVGDIYSQTKEKNHVARPIPVMENKMLVPFV